MNNRRFLVLMLVLTLIFGLWALARGEEISKDFPYLEDFETQFRAFVEEAVKELAKQNCSQGVIVAFLKDEKTITVVAKCVRYHEQEK